MIKKINSQFIPSLVKAVVLGFLTHLSLYLKIHPKQTFQYHPFYAGVRKLYPLLLPGTLQLPYKEFYWSRHHGFWSQLFQLVSLHELLSQSLQIFVHSDWHIPGNHPISGEFQFAWVPAITGSHRQSVQSRCLQTVPLNQTVPGE